MNKKIYITVNLMLFILLLSLAGCKNDDSKPKIKNTVGSVASEQNTNSTVSQITADKQSSPAKPANISEKMEEFYKEWDKEQLKTNKTDFVNYYSLNRAGSDSLLIYLDGSMNRSVMGLKDGNNWISPGNAYSLAKIFSDFSFLTMEKTNIKMGCDHMDDPMVIKNDTFDNRVDSTVKVIDTFLNYKEYKNIIIFGISEGGNILPKVYTGLKEKDKITKLVVLGAGGLSQYEEFKILGKSELPMQAGDKEEYMKVEDAYKDILKSPESVDQTYFGLPYKRWYGYMKYNPLDDYKKIDIPILLLHGAKDTNSPVETARTVNAEFQKLGKRNLKYLEYTDMGHGPENKEENNIVFGDIKNWIKTYNT